LVLPNLRIEKGVQFRVREAVSVGLVPATDELGFAKRQGEGCSHQTNEGELVRLRGSAGTKNMA
jgi:hypothetical protein